MRVHPKRVLITGAAGGVGIHVLDHFLGTTNWEVVVLDSFRHKGYRDRITRVLQDHPEYASRLTVIQHELTCPIGRSVRKQIGHADYILHLAALSDVFFSVDNPVFTIQNNINSTLTMLEYARRTNPTAFVYFSTDEVYGPVPKGEAHAEGEPHKPSNPYAASKAACEDICYAYWRSYDLPLIITNTMNNFGEMQSASKFPVLIQKAVDGGREVVIHGNEEEIGTRFYIHSRNVADALRFILRSKPTHHQIGELDEPDRYHIVGQKAVSNLELATTIAALMHKHLHYRMVDFHRENPAHDIHYGLQDNKLRAAGWEQQGTFELDLSETIAWQQANPEWIK